MIEELSPDDARAVHRALLEVNVQGLSAAAIRTTSWPWTGARASIPTATACCGAITKSRSTRCRSSCSLQAWVKATGQRVVILFEGATRPARAGPSSA